MHGFRVWAFRRQGKHDLLFTVGPKSMRQTLSELSLRCADRKERDIARKRDQIAHGACERLVWVADRKSGCTPD